MCLRASSFVGTTTPQRFAIPEDAEILGLHFVGWQAAGTFYISFAGNVAEFAIDVRPSVITFPPGHHFPAETYYYTVQGGAIRLGEIWYDDGK